MLSIQENTNRLLSAFDDREKGFWVWFASVIPLILISGILVVLVVAGYFLSNPEILDNPALLQTPELLIKVEDYDRDAVIRRTLTYFLSVAVIFPGIFVALKMFRLKVSDIIAPGDTVRWGTIWGLALTTLVIAISGVLVFGWLDEVQYSYEPHSGWGWGVVVVMIPIVALQAMTEELFFRGYLLQLVGRFTRRWWLILLIIAGLFFAMHLSNPPVEVFGWYALFSYAMSSVLFTFLALKTGRLEYSIALHIGWNWSVLFVDTRLSPDMYMGIGSFVIDFKPDIISAVQDIFVAAGLYYLAMMFYRKNISSGYRGSVEAVPSAGE
ncbi:CPBP family intramembrane metalloprotease [Kiloniella laminariae]|uniref:CPBP family intramembrane metalloprotease n=1 Tax=Kiloniella laminariae TaxID=454162 RepID=A0ABT4LFW6_9PROT|nr:CPBP family intramembrane glutamic endopeptidase [Kiloniella laminariae]MCZ4280001.1 CPBP family intramembrane metalloprotease [Kiloniella laminariae]